MELSDTIIAGLFVTIVGGIIVAILSGQGGFAHLNFRSLVNKIVDRLKIATYHVISKTMSFIRNYWRMLLSWALLIIVFYSIFLYTQNPFAIFVTFLFYLSILLVGGATDSERRKSRQRWVSQARLTGKDFTVIPLAKIGNDNLAKKYAGLPYGQIEFNGIEFFIQPGNSAFDSSLPLPSGEWENAVLEFDSPISYVKSLHLLINAGGGYKNHPEDGTPLAGMKIGAIQIVFQDGSSSKTEFVLGENIREWAIENMPDLLVDTVTDKHSREAWRGRNISGNTSVVDQLEIPLQSANNENEIRRIEFHRYIGREAKPSGGKGLALFVSAITAEIR